MGYIIVALFLLLDLFFFCLLLLFTKQIHLLNTIPNK